MAPYPAQPRYDRPRPKTPFQILVVTIVTMAVYSDGLEILVLFLDDV